MRFPTNGAITYWLYRLHTEKCYLHPMVWLRPNIEFTYPVKWALRKNEASDVQQGGRVWGGGLEGGGGSELLFPELEFLKSLWGLGSEEEEGYRTGPPGYIGWRNSFLGIDSGAPYTFKNTGSDLCPQGVPTIRPGNWRLARIRRSTKQNWTTRRGLKVTGIPSLIHVLSYHIHFSNRYNWWQRSYSHPR